MKALFHILTLLAAGGAGFFSYQNLGKFKEQQEQKNVLISENTTKKREISSMDAQLQKEIVDRDAANKDRTDVQFSVDTLKSSENTLRSKLTAVDSELAEQKSKFEELDKIRAKVAGILDGVGVELEELPAEVVKFEQERKDKTEELEELKSNVESAKKLVEGNVADIGRLTERDAARSARIRRNALQSVVRSVNEDYGFVVIGAGSNTGFTPQTKLLVLRDGRLIAEVKPSAIEPSQTIAEIDLDTIAPGARIQPGDRVILAEGVGN